MHDVLLASSGLTCGDRSKWCRHIPGIEVSAIVFLSCFHDPRQSPRQYVVPYPHTRKCLLGNSMVQHGEVLKHCPFRLVSYSFLHNEDVTDLWVRLYRMASRRSIGTVVLGSHRLVTQRLCTRPRSTSHPVLISISALISAK